MENFMHLRSLLGRNIDKLLIFLRKKSQIMDKKRFDYLIANLLFYILSHIQLLKKINGS